MTRRKATRAFRVVVGKRWQNLSKDDIRERWEAFTAGLAERKQINQKQLGAW